MMLAAAAVWVTQLVLAAVFAVAAGGKWADREAVRVSVAGFGVPMRYVGPVATGLPAVETALAAGVLIPWTAFGAAVVAVGLLLVFTAAVLRAVVRGVAVSCACFGAASARPVSWWTVARNGALIGWALLVAVGTTAHPGLPGGLPVERAGYLAALVAVGALLWWQHGMIARLKREVSSGPKRSGLPLSSPAPEFTATTTSGEPRDLAGLTRRGRPVLLVFMHPECTPCGTLADELTAWRERLAGAVPLVVLSGGATAEVASWAARHRLDEVLVQDGFRTARAYGMRGTPGAVLVDSRRRIASPAATGTREIRALLDTVAARHGRSGGR